MKKLMLSVVLQAILIIPLLAFAYTGGAGLYDSPHDFIKPGHAAEFGVPLDITGTAPDGTTAAGVGICTFCHTPHRGLTNQLIWNHTLSSNTLGWDATDKTIGGTPLPTSLDTWAGPSKLCLSCHDGSVAIGDIAWYYRRDRLGGSKLSGVANAGFEDDDLAISGALAKYNVCPAGDCAGVHPVGVPYPFGALANTYNGITTGDFVDKTQFEADPRAEGIRLFQNTGGTNVTAFNNNVAAGGETNIGIECSSCHDPHNGSTVKDDPLNGRPLLLRGTAWGDGNGEGSETYADGTDDYICVKCHDMAVLP